MSTSPTTRDLLASAAQCRAQLTGPGAPFELETITVNGQSMTAYRRALASLPDLLNAGRVHGELEFMVYEGDRWTFSRFFAAVDALSGRLQAQCGIQKADRVAIAMRNRPEWAVAFVAVALLGAIPVPLNSFGLHEELMDNLRDIGAKLLICDQDRHARVATDLPGLGCTALVVDAASPGPLDWAAMTSPGGPVCQPPVLGADDPALILFTSGASTKAKGVLSNQRAVCQALCNIDYIGALSAMTSPAVVAVMMARRLQPTTLTAVPLFHVSGLHAQLLAALRHGRRLVFMHRWDPATALAMIRAERITQFNGAPAMVQQLLAQPGFDDPDLTSTLMGIGFGGAGLPQRLIDEVQKRRGEGMNGIGFGMTETNGVGAAAAGNLFQAFPDKAGLLSPIIELRVAEFDGTPIPTGEAGELWMRGVTVMQAYWAQPDATAAVFSDGWLRSGDIGIVDADGLLRVVDRIKDVINRNGEKIAAAEVESCLLQHPGIVEAAVFSQPDDLTGEAVVAAVVTAPGVELTQEAVRAHVASHLAAYKVPLRVFIRWEPLPRNPAGKMLKTTIKRELSQA